jgi:type III pantothenate kinase
MEFLDIDAGNTRLGWRLVKGDKVVLTGSSSRDGSGLPDHPAATVRLGSVLSEPETSALAQKLKCLYSCVWEAKVRNNVCGLRLAYEDEGRLGVDRWLAVLAAMHLTQGPLIVVDVGTAITIDEVSSSGEHLGGIIAPGSRLMLESLGWHTGRLPVLDACEGGHRLVRGRSTESCIQSGVLMSQLGLVRLYLETMAQPEASIYLTGGGASGIHPYLPVARFEAHLVLTGLDYAWRAQRGEAA